jgi:hypothetical protein
MIVWYNKENFHNILKIQVMEIIAIRDK